MFHVIRKQQPFGGTCAHTCHVVWQFKFKSTGTGTRYTCTCQLSTHTCHYVMGTTCVQVSTYKSMHY